MRFKNRVLNRVLISVKINFLGAAETVTGSKYLLTLGEDQKLKERQKKILIDCGLFQGSKILKARNWEEFPLDINPSEIDAVVLTHAHLDHSGYLPVLIKKGFKGPIYATRGTFDLCSILLPDSGHIQEEDANFANKHGYSSHKPALPLYTRDEALSVLNFFKILEFKKTFELFKGCELTFRRAAHILGASCVEINYLGQKIVFSGDLGRLKDPIMKEPEFIQEADFLILESTYGDSVHDKTSPLEELERVINKTIGRGGSVIIPAFAVGRTQALLYYISMLKQAGKIPDIPVFLDSPLAQSATDIYSNHLDEHCLSKGNCLNLESAAQYIRSVEDSKRLDLSSFPSIIIAASGMAEGGRILHHLKSFAPYHQHTILFTGYQAGGTLGQRIANKKDREVKIHGMDVFINAEVLMMSNMSAHADSEEILIWLKKFKSAPKKVFITHGEAGPAESLKNKIETELNWFCQIPKYLEEIKLK